MKYKVYHAEPMNFDCKTSGVVFKYITTVVARSRQVAFEMSQNDWNGEYAALGVRPTSVGDILQSEMDERENACYMVMGIGFNRIDSSCLTYRMDTITAVQKHELGLLLAAYEAAGRRDEFFIVALMKTGVAKTLNEALKLLEGTKLFEKAGYLPVTVDARGKAVEETPQVIRCSACGKIADGVITFGNVKNLCYLCYDKYLEQKQKEGL